MLEGWTASEKYFDMLSGERFGKVIASFSSGIYLELSGEVLMIHDTDNAFLPFGIAVDNFKGRGRILGLEPGMEIECSNGILRCNATDFKLKVMKAENIKTVTNNNPIPAFAQRAAELDSLLSRSALSIYAKCEIENIFIDDIRDIFARAALKGLRLLVKALEDNCTETMEESLNYLIGLGRGLTPSLDDFLCGMVFMMHYAENIWNYNQPYLVALCDILTNNAPSRTNVYSSAYLLSAAAGEDFSVLRKCIESADTPEFDEYARRLLSIGSSSGADMLSGMCFAANYILKQL